MFKFGTVVLVPFPFTDLTSTKLRPALIVSRTNDASEDIMVTFITSKIPKQRNKSHFLLNTSDQYFPKTGLKTNSIFRFDKIATLNKKLILGELGSVALQLLRRMKPFFAAAFGFSHL